MKKQVAAIVLAFCMTLEGAAQSVALEHAKKKDSPRMTLSIATLGCSTSAGSNTFDVASYSFGASNPSTIGAGGIGAGKASISSFNLLKKFDECSPSLFGGVVQGKHFPTADFVQRDASGDTVLTISLTEVVVESFQISGSAADDAPAESVSIAFKKICISEPGSSNKLCFDRSANATF